MIAPTDLLDLAARCEAAEGPDRGLDCEIGVAIGRFFTQPNKGWPDRLDYCERHGDTFCYPGNGFDQLVPRYTDSLDAAMALVPEGWRPVIDATFTRPEVKLWLWDKDPTAREFGKANTPALALCAAALRARSTPQ